MDDKIFICGICGYKTNRKFDLKRHTDSISHNKKLGILIKKIVIKEPITDSGV